MAKHLTLPSSLPLRRKTLSRERVVRELRFGTLDGGLNSEIPSETLPHAPAKSPRMRDVLFIQGEARKTYGSLQIGDTLGEDPRWVGLWERANETIQPLVLTATDLYSYNGVSWSKITPNGVLTGTDQRFATAVLDDVFYFSSRSNALRSWSGSGSHAAVATGFKAKFMEVIDSHIVLAYTESAGVSEPYTVRWSQSGVSTFTGVGSGANDLLDRNDYIMNIVKVGSFRGFIYKDSSVVEIRATGSSVFPFEFTEILGGVGLLLPWTLVAHTAGNFFVSSDERIYQYDGAALNDISQEIRTEFFSNLDQTRPEFASAAYIPETNEYLVEIPVTGSTAGKLFYAYHLGRKRWRSGIYDGVNSIGSIRASLAQRWIDDTTTWTAETQAWNFAPLVLDQRSTVLATRSKKILALDMTQLSFDGSALQFSWETPDIHGETTNEEITLLSIEIHYVVKGTATLTVDVSTDRGTTFGNPTVATLSGTDGNLAHTSVSLITTGDHIRIRLRNSVSSEELKILEIRAFVSYSGNRGVVIG